MSRATNRHRRARPLTGRWRLGFGHVMVGPVIEQCLHQNTRRWNAPPRWQPKVVLADGHLIHVVPGAGPTNSCRMTGAAQRLTSSRVRLAMGGFCNTYLVVASPMTNALINPIR
jgi:hypothetical protein